MGNMLPLQPTPRSIALKTYLSDLVFLDLVHTWQRRRVFCGYIGSREAVLNVSQATVGTVLMLLSRTSAACPRREEPAPHLG